MEDSLKTGLKNLNERYRILTGNDISIEEDKDLEFVVSFEVFPEISLADFGNIKIEKLSAEINESEIDSALEKVRNHFADWVVVERAAKSRPF